MSSILVVLAKISPGLEWKGEDHNIEKGEDSSAITYQFIPYIRVPYTTGTILCMLKWYDIMHVEMVRYYAC